jgi:hypothetical protein
MFSIVVLEKSASVIVLRPDVGYVSAVVVDFTPVTGTNWGCSD